MALAERTPYAFENLYLRPFFTHQLLALELNFALARNHGDGM